MTSINHTGSERRFLMQRLIFDVATATPEKLHW
mgnify:CR=1 FL=1